MLEESEPQDEVLVGWADAQLAGQAAYAAYQEGDPLPTNPYNDERAVMWVEGFSLKRWEAEGKPKLTLAEEVELYAAGQTAYRLEAATGAESPIPYDRNSLVDVLASLRSEIWTSGFYDAQAADVGDGFEVLGEPRRVIDI